MDAETRFAYRVGIVVICAAIIMAILLTLFGETWTSQYTIVVKTQTAPNVSKNTPVRRNGIRIGRVADVVNEGQEVQLYLKIDSGQPVFQNEVCEIGTASLLGDAVIDFMPGSKPISGIKLEDGDTVDPADVVIEPNPVEMIASVMDLETQLDTTLRSIEKASDNVADAAKKADTIIGGVQDAIGGENGGIEELLTTVRGIKLAADNFAVVMELVQGIIGNPEFDNNIQTTVQMLPDLLGNLRQATIGAEETIKSFQDVSRSAGQNLNNLEDFTAALGNEGTNIIKTLETTTQQLDTLLSEFNSMASGDKTQGTIGKLLSDPELYDNLNATVRNAREISDQLKPIVIQLQPLMNDVRYAVDGIARDPGQLGVRGALNRSQPFGQFKGTIAPKPQYR